jgi:hypothetical protein
MEEFRGINPRLLKHFGLNALMWQGWVRSQFSGFSTWILRHGVANEIQFAACFLFDTPQAVTEWPQQNAP